MVVQKNIESNYPSGVYRYSEYVSTITNFWGAEGFHNSNLRLISDLIKQIVDKEAPIQKDLVKRRVCDAFQIRLGSRIDWRIDCAINQAVVFGWVGDSGDSLLSPKKNSNVLRVYVDGDYKRSIEEISPIELEIAITKCLENSLSISVDDLCREIARLFGLRATEKVKSYLLEHFEMMVLKKMIEVKYGKVQLPK